MRNEIMLTLCTGIVVGCGGYGEGGGTDLPEDVTRMTSALDICSYSYTQYSEAGGTTVGPSASTHLCFLTEVRAANRDHNGDPASGHTTAVSVQINDDGNWSLDGWGTMTCVKQCNFWHSSPSAVRWLSDNYTTVIASNTTPATAKTNIFGSWAGSMVQGAWNPYGFESMTWASYPPPPAGRYLYVTLTSGAYALGFGTSFFVGPLPFYEHQVRVAGPWTLGAASTNTSGTLPVLNSEAICYFKQLYPLRGQAGVSWDLDTRKFRIYRSGFEWRWQSIGGIGIRPQAKVECMYFNQN
jgi:hypothetical protein